MGEIVQSLFGPSPDEIRMQQMQAMDAQSRAFAQMTPQERATYGISQGAGMLGGQLAESMGMVNPAMQQAQQRQQAMVGGNVGSSAGLRAAAERMRQMGDLQRSYMLIQLADKKDAEDADLEYKRAQAKALGLPKTENATKVGLTEKTKEVVYEQGGQQYVIRGGVKVPYEGAIYEKPAQTINVGDPQGAFEKELGKKQGEAIVASKASADESVQIINTINEGRSIIKQGMVSGFGANALVSIGQALKQSGIDFGGDATSNSQAYAANMAQNVGRVIKQFGAGTGLSDADREYAAKMSAGEISLDEKSLLKILDINEKAARNIINKHNKEAKGIKSPINLIVELPGDEESSSTLKAPPTDADINATALKYKMTPAQVRAKLGL